MIASQNQAGTSAGNFPTTEAAIEALNNANDSTAGLINLTVGSNSMLSDADLAAAQAATSQNTATGSGANASLDSTVAADPDLTGSVESNCSRFKNESSSEYKVGDIVTDDRIVGRLRIYI
jgi:hypothetical protein